MVVPWRKVSSKFRTFLSILPFLWTNRVLSSISVSKSFLSLYVWVSSFGFCTSRSDEFPVFIGEIPRSLMCSKVGGGARGKESGWWTDKGPHPWRGSVCCIPSVLMCGWCLLWGTGRRQGFCNLRKWLYVVRALAQRFQDKRFFWSSVHGPFLTPTYNFGNKVKCTWRLGLHCGK